MTHNTNQPATPVLLREVRVSDIDVLYPFQIDPQANHMAAFTAKEPHTPESFRAWWARILANPAVVNRVILFGDAIVGSIMKFDRDGVPEVTYWLGREYWGNGIATAALRLLLAQVATRPLNARVAKDNTRSRRVLEKCGFQVAAEERGFANARGQEIDELVLVLKA